MDTLGETPTEAGHYKRAALALVGNGIDEKMLAEARPAARWSTPGGVSATLRKRCSNRECWRSGSRA